jgi:hypothetical protein
MYMNCAVVDITNKSKNKRDTQASAVIALSKFPELFVANLADINSCKIQETTNAIFDDPGKDVSYGGGDSSSMKSPFAKGQCTGKPSKNAGSKDTSSSNSGGGGGGGGGGQWTAPAKTSTQLGGCAAKIASGQWHPECGGSQSQGRQQQQPTQQQPTQQQPSAQKQASKQSQQPQKPEQDKQKMASKGKPNTRVQQELDAYLATLYGHARRDALPAAEYLAPHDQENEHAANLNAHVHTKDREHSSSAYQRIPRQERWTSYNKRAQVPGAVNEVPAEASPQPSTQTSTDTTAQTPSAVPAQRSYNDMTDIERFNAYLERMVELSNNLASLIKYAAASSVRVPYYPPRKPAPVAEDTVTESDQNTAAILKLAKRGDLDYSTSTSQHYPGPRIGSISAAGEATDADDGFMRWFPNLVQNSLAKRQLVDPVTSPASAEAGDNISFFDMLMTGLWKLVGDPFNFYSDEPDTSIAPNPTDIPLLHGEPVLPTGPPFIPDFDIPDLDGGYTFPPQILAPEPPAPELIDPLADDSSTDVPTIIISIDPVDSTDDIFPGLDVPTLTPCVQPIPQVGFNSCWGGCNHTASEIAQHEIYLQNLAEEEAAYEECLTNQSTNSSSSSSSSPSHGILYEPDDGEDDAWQSDSEDASGRKPRPGQSLPLIPSPLPDNYTLPSPLNATETPFDSTAATPSPLNASKPASNDTATLPLLPYQNKTLGELVDAILSNPVMLEAPEPVVVDDTDAEASPALTPVPSDSSDDAPPVDAPTGTNPLQEAADQAEEGATAPQESEAAEPNALKTIHDALPWLVMGPGPVVTSGLPKGVDEPPQQ